jgi:hypothetical protein
VKLVVFSFSFLKKQKHCVTTIPFEIFCFMKYFWRSIPFELNFKEKRS